MTLFSYWRFKFDSLRIAQYNDLSDPIRTSELNVLTTLTEACSTPLRELPLGWLELCSRRHDY
jgi:hypothetical protein